MIHLHILGEQGILQIHAATLRVLSEAGILLTHPGARLVGERVMLPPELVEKCVAEGATALMSIAGRLAQQEAVTLVTNLSHISN